MLRYAGRRLLQMIPVFFGATLLIYAMVFALPGDPVAALGGDRALSPALQAQIRAQYNLDQPFFVQYLLFLKGIATFDLGTTIRGSRPIVDVLAGAYPVTVKLSLMALAFEAVAGIAIGLLAGVRKGGIFDATVLVLSLVVIAVPTFVIGFLLQFFIGVKLGWLPVTVGSTPGFKELLMPAIVLGAVSFAYVLRLTRTDVGENLSADHVRTARAKGLIKRKAITRHALRTALIPMGTFFAFALAGLFTGAAITETVFTWHGLGEYSITSISTADINGTVAVVAFSGMMTLIGALLSDVLVAVIDPRVRVS